jgi:MFS transporter, PPP family, 3-phenylpropionic acid transporter
MRSWFRVSNRFRLFYALDFGSIGILFPYLVLYLSSIGLTGTQIGVILGIMPLASFLVQPLWGFISDLYHLQRKALVLACFGLAGTSALFGLTTDFRLLIVLSLLIAITRAPISPLGTALALDHLERNAGRATFGALRLWGSIGFAVTSLAIGALFVETAVWVIIPAYSITLFLLGLVVLTLPDSEIHGEVNWREGATLLSRDPVLARFLFGCLLVGMTMGIVNNYLAVYMDDINAAGWMIGVAFSLSAIMEVPLMARAPSFLARWGMRLVLVGGAAVLPVRWLLYTVIREPILVIPTQVLHSIAVMALLVVGVIYVDQRLTASWRATGQGLYSAALHGVGPSIGLFSAGIIYDRAGITPVWLACAVLSTIGVMILSRTVRAPVAHAARQEVPT